MSRGAGSLDADALRYFRQRKGLSKAQLAEKIHTSARQIAAYESGRQIPEPGRIASLATALDVPAFVLSGARPSTATVADLRRMAGLTVAQAASDIGISTATYRRIEHDGIWKRDETALLQRIAAALDCDMRQLAVALEANPKTMTRVREASTIINQLAVAACEQQTVNIQLKRTDPRVRLVAEATGYAAANVWQATNAYLRLVRNAAREVAVQQVQLAWASSPPTETRSKKILGQRQELLRGLTANQLERVTSMLKDLLPAAEWALMVELYQVGGQRPWLRLEEPELEKIIAKLIRRGLVQYQTMSRQPYVADKILLTDEGSAYFTSSRVRRHERVHPHVSARHIYRAIVDAERIHRRLHQGDLQDDR